MIKRSSMGMIKSTETLLSLLSQLKQSLLLNDVEYLNSLIGARKTVLEEKSAENLQFFKYALEELKKLDKELEDVLLL